LTATYQNAPFARQTVRQTGQLYGQKRLAARKIKATSRFDVKKPAQYPNRAAYTARVYGSPQGFSKAFMAERHSGTVCFGCQHNGKSALHTIALFHKAVPVKPDIKHVPTIAGVFLSVRLEKSTILGGF
jgi:hypothetical protein